MNLEIPQKVTVFRSRHDEFGFVEKPVRHHKYPVGDGFLHAYHIPLDDEYVHRGGETFVRYGGYRVEIRTQA